MKTLLAGVTLVLVAALPFQPEIGRFYLPSRKLADGPQPLRVAHVAAPPGPDALRALRTAVVDLIVYTGPNPSGGDARERLVHLAALAPAFALDDRGGPPIAATGMRVLADPIQLDLRGQAIDLALAHEGPAGVPAMLRALAMRDAYTIVAARTADLAPVLAGDPGHGVDLFLAATAGASGQRTGLAPRGALMIHVAGRGLTSIFTLGPLPAKAR